MISTLQIRTANCIKQQKATNKPAKVWLFFFIGSIPVPVTVQFCSTVGTVRLYFFI
jgi:hypothetical protein